jgi:beta-lactamase class A
MKKVVLILAVLLILAGLAAGGYFAYQALTSSKEPEAPPSPTEEELKAQRVEKQKLLIETIQEIWKIESPTTGFSIGIYDLKHEEYFGYNDTAPQHAASVSKVLTGVVLLDRVDKGQMSLADPLGAYNVEFQLEKMINISNEPSWDLIDAKLGIAPQNEFAKSIGLTTVDLNANVMSVKDMTTLLKMLAKGEVLSEASRERLLTYMQNTESEDYFSPAFKLSETQPAFYHKTGKYLGEGHDAAIVELENNPFVLVVFSNNNTSPSLIARGSVMQKTAETVLEFFEDL